MESYKLFFQSHYLVVIKNVILFLTINLIIFSSFGQNELSVLDSIQSIRQSIFSNPKSAKEALNSIKDKISNQDSLELYSYYETQGILESVSGNPLKALNFFKNGTKFSQNIEQKLNLLVSQSIVSKDLKLYQEAHSLLNRAERYAPNHKDSVAWIRIYSSRASLFKIQGYLDLAVENCLNAIRIINKTHQNKYDLNIERQKLGNTYLELGDFDFAISEYEEIIPYFSQNNDLYTLAITKLNYAEALFNDGKLRKANEVNNEAIDSFKSLENNSLLSLAISQKADILSRSNPKSKKIDNLYNEALELSIGLNSQYQLNILFKYLIFLKNNDFRSEFIDMFQKSKSYFQTSSLSLEEKIEYSFLLKTFYTYNNQIQEAFDISEKIISLKDSLSIEELSLKAKELQIKYKMKNLQIDNRIITSKKEILERENRLNKQLMFFLLFLVIFGFLVLVLVLRTFAKSRKIQKLKLDQSSVTISKKSIQQKELSQNLIKKSIELDKLITHMNKITLLKKQLENILDQNKKNSDDEAIFMQLKVYVNSFFNSYKELGDIDQFQMEIKKAVQDIKTKHPNLNERDIKVLKFIKMKFTSKEIAVLMDKSEKSIEYYRSQIRKKMDLKKEMILENYLNDSF